MQNFERDRIASQSHLDGLLRQRLCLPFKEGLTCECSIVSRPHRTTARIARLAFLKSASLFPPCISKGHRARRSVFGTHEKFVNGKKIEVAVGLAASSNHGHMT